MLREADSRIGLLHFPDIGPGDGSESWSQARRIHASYTHNATAEGPEGLPADDSQSFNAGVELSFGQRIEGQSDDGSASLSQARDLTLQADYTAEAQGDRATQTLRFGLEGGLSYSSTGSTPDGGSKTQERGLRYSAEYTAMAADVPLDQASQRFNADVSLRFGQSSDTPLDNGSLSQQRELTLGAEYTAEHRPDDSPDNSEQTLRFTLEGQSGQTRRENSPDGGAESLTQELRYSAAYTQTTDASGGEGSERRLGFAFSQHGQRSGSLEGQDYEYSHSIRLHGDYTAAESPDGQSREAFQLGLEGEVDRSYSEQDAESGLEQTRRFGIDYALGIEGEQSGIDGLIQDQRQVMTGRLGVDFSDTRVHTDGGHTERLAFRAGADLSFSHSLDGSGVETTTVELETELGLEGGSEYTLMPEGGEPVADPLSLFRSEWDLSLGTAHMFSYSNNGHFQFSESASLRAEYSVAGLFSQGDTSVFAQINAFESESFNGMGYAVESGQSTELGLAWEHDNRRLSLSYIDAPGQTARSEVRYEIMGRNNSTLSLMADSNRSVGFSVNIPVLNPGFR
ncbi:MAG: hypothetical protein IGS03_03130 [Candidatus Sericytochromatia bacterium]|nr:hypothetical protein [Candidatus Sericytochromatia bacterium]